MLDERKQLYEWLADHCALDAALRAFAPDENAQLPVPLIDALFVADATREDRREEESASVCVVDTEEYPLWEICVDQHETPRLELRRLHETFRERLVPGSLRIPPGQNPAGDPSESNA